MWEHNGTTSKHHSKVLKQWAFAVPLSDSSDSDASESGGEEDGETGAPIPQSAEVHAQRKKDFDKIAKSLEGTTVTVSILVIITTRYVAYMHRS